MQNEKQKYTTVAKILKINREITESGKVPHYTGLVQALELLGLDQFYGAKAPLLVKGCSHENTTDNISKFHRNRNMQPRNKKIRWFAPVR